LAELSCVGDLWQMQAVNLWAAVAGATMESPGLQARAEAAQAHSIRRLTELFENEPVGSGNRREMSKRFASDDLRRRLSELTEDGDGELTVEEFTAATEARNREALARWTHCYRDKLNSVAMSTPPTPRTVYLALEVLGSFSLEMGKESGRMQMNIPGGVFLAWAEPGMYENVTFQGVSEWMPKMIECSDVWMPLVRTVSQGGTMRSIGTDKMHGVDLGMITALPVGYPYVALVHTSVLQSEHSWSSEFHWYPNDAHWLNISFVMLNSISGRDRFGTCNDDLLHVDFPTIVARDDPDANMIPYLMDGVYPVAYRDYKNVLHWGDDFQYELNHTLLGNTWWLDFAVEAPFTVGPSTFGGSFETCDFSMRVIRDPTGYLSRTFLMDSLIVMVGLLATFIDPKIPPLLSSRNSLIAFAILITSLGLLRSKPGLPFLSVNIFLDWSAIINLGMLIFAFVGTMLVHNLVRHQSMYLAKKIDHLLPRMLLSLYCVFLVFEVTVILLSSDGSGRDTKRKIFSITYLCLFTPVFVGVSVAAVVGPLLKRRRAIAAAVRTLQDCSPGSEDDVGACEKLFVVFDRDKNGSLETHEVRALFAAMFPQASRAGITRVLTHVELADDGDVTKEELQTALRHRGEFEAIIEATRSYGGGYPTTTVTRISNGLKNRTHPTIAKDV